MRWIRICFVCMVLFFITACSSMKSTPEKTIENLEKSIQQMDFEAVLNCYEPHVARGIKAISKLAGSIVGIDGEAIFDMIPLLMDIAAASGGSGYTDIADMCKSIELRITSLEYNDDKTEATATVEFLIDGNPEGTDIMKLVKTDEKWYLKIN